MLLLMMATLVARAWGECLANQFIPGLDSQSGCHPTPNACQLDCEADRENCLLEDVANCTMASVVGPVKTLDMDKDKCEMLCNQSSSNVDDGTHARCRFWRYVSHGNVNVCTHN